MKLQWSASLGSQIAGCPISDGRRVVVATVEGEVRVYDMRGQWLCTTQTERINPRSTLALHGTHAYVGTAAGRLYCIDLQNGSVLWRTQLEAEIASGITSIGEMLYLGTEAGVCACVRRMTGALHWTFRARDSIGGCPAVCRSSVIYGSDDYMLYALSTGDGKKIWKYRTDFWVQTSPSVGFDLVYIGSHADLCAIGVVDAISRWTVPTWQEVLGGIANDGTRVVFSGSQGITTCVNAVTGVPIWSHQAQDAIVFGVTLSCDHAYVASYDGCLYVLCLATGKVIDCDHIDPMTSCTIVDEHVFVGCEDKRLYCYEAASRGPSNWLMARQNPFGTGSCFTPPQR